MLAAAVLRSKETSALAAITALWAMLLLVLHAKGLRAHALLVPIPGEFYYAFEAAFLPSLVSAQLALGSWSLGRAGVTNPRKHAARALAASAACFVGPDVFLVALGRLDLLPLWARAAGPLALLVAVFVLRRACPKWSAVLRTLFLISLPALLFVR